jgi:uncharacterized cupin superfamily protein
MVEEAKLAATESGLVPQGAGWFVLNAREARWHESPVFDSYCTFEGEERFPEVGINISVLQPGRPGCMYHGEEGQEGFLVLSGQCLLLVEGEERPLEAWDFFHCAPWTEHVLVGAGDGPCVVVGVGARKQGAGVVYPHAEVADRHGAGVPETTSEPKEAYAPFPDSDERPYREGDLPDW